MVRKGRVGGQFFGMGEEFGGISGQRQNGPRYIGSRDRVNFPSMVHEGLRSGL